MLAPQLEDRVIDHLVRDHDRLLVGDDAAVIAEIDGGLKGHGGLEADRPAFQDLEAGRANRRQALLPQGFLVRLRDKALDGFIEDHVRAEGALDDGAGRPALAEARDAVAQGEPPRGVVERLLDALVVDFDLEDHLGLRDALRGDFHERPGAPDLQYSSGTVGSRQRPRGLTTSLMASPNRLKQ